VNCSAVRSPIRISRRYRKEAEILFKMAQFQVVSLGSGRSCRPTADSAGTNAGKTMNSKRLVDGAVEDGGDLAHFVGQDGKFLGEDGLHAVGEGFVRFVMDFDEQAIGADGDGRAG